MRKDYYKILKVSRDENPEGIRAAYRRMAKIHHPDCAGQQGTAYFQDISEAYRTLSDPEKRKSYDEAYAGERINLKVCKPYRFYPEPLIPTFPQRRFRSKRSSFEDVFERVWADNGSIENELHENYDATIFLTQEEAQLGCLLNFGIMVPHECMACGGTGSFWTFSCNHCGGIGNVHENLLFRFRIPPMVEDGAAFEFPLRTNGSNDRVRFHIEIRATE